MLKEIKNVRQIEGEGLRRWFSGNYFELILWYNEKNEISGFQLCYGLKGLSPKALTWKDKSGYTHDSVDDGEHTATIGKMTPVLMADGQFDQDKILDIFVQESQELDQKIVGFICSKLTNYQ